MAPPQINVKVCFIMDCTASMGPWIHQAKTKMVDLINQVREETPTANIKVSFIGYRDYGDEERIIEIPFQDSESTMAQIQGVEAIGGNDLAEDVAHGLEAALHQDWNDSDVKIVFLIADAPAHGSVFHAANVSDRYPRGDPEGFDPRDFVERMSFLNIDFTFVRMHERTDTMIEVFNDIYIQGGVFKVIDLTPQNHYRYHDLNGVAPPPLDHGPTILSLELTRSITDSITHHYRASQAL